MSEESLQDRLDRLKDGDTLTLKPTDEAKGPVVLRKAVAIVGAAATIWAARGPVVRIESGGVVLRHLNVEVTGREADLEGEAACALVVRPGVSVSLEDVTVRGDVIGLDREEGVWRHPRTLSLGTLKAGTAHEFAVMLSIPTRCVVECDIDGLHVQPREIQGEPVKMTLRLDCAGRGDARPRPAHPPQRLPDAAHHGQRPGRRRSDERRPRTSGVGAGGRRRYVAAPSQPSPDPGGGQGGGIPEDHHCGRRRVRPVAAPGADRGEASVAADGAQLDAVLAADDARVRARRRRGDRGVAGRGRPFPDHRRGALRGPAGDENPGAARRLRREPGAGPPRRDRRRRVRRRHRRREPGRQLPADADRHGPRPRLDAARLRSPRRPRPLRRSHSPGPAHSRRLPHQLRLAGVRRRL